MFVQSNDLFYRPGTAGRDLFTTDGLPVTGDITAQVQLWDAAPESTRNRASAPIRLSAKPVPTPALLKAA